MTRPRRQTLIDGYNLLHRAAAGAPASSRTTGGAARHRLLRRIEKAAAWLGDAVTVVFDGRDGRPADEDEFHGVTTVFTDPSISADIWIARAVTSAPSPRRLLVVSSDLAVRHSAEAAGATTMSSGEFLEMCDRLDRRTAAQPRRTASGFAPRLGDFFDQTSGGAELRSPPE